MKQITIHNLDTSTKQEVFDFVAHHLLTQNQKSLNVDGLCRYRLNDSLLKCAAGALIPDADYHAYIEGQTWEYDSVIMILYPLAQTNHIDLIRSLQLIHDCSDVEQWRDRLVACCNANYLLWNF